MNTALYLHARSPSRSVSSLTPYEKLFGVKPELGHLRRFGCAAYKIIPEAQRTGKFGERAKKCIFLGYVHETVKIWRLWDRESKRVIQASDIRFSEAETMGERQSTSTEDQLVVLRSCIHDGILVGDAQSAPMEEVIRVVAPNPWGDNVNAPSQTIVECGSIEATDSSSLPEGEGTGGTKAVSDHRPENPPAPVLRRSG